MLSRQSDIMYFDVQDVVVWHEDQICHRIHLTSKEVRTNTGHEQKGQRQVYQRQQNQLVNINSVNNVSSNQVFIRISEGSQ